MNKKENRAFSRLLAAEYQEGFLNRIDRFTC